MAYEQREYGGGRGDGGPEAGGPQAGFGRGRGKRKFSDFHVSTSALYWYRLCDEMRCGTFWI